MCALVSRHWKTQRTAPYSVAAPGAPPQADGTHHPPAACSTTCPEELGAEGCCRLVSARTAAEGSQVSGRTATQLPPQPSPQFPEGRPWSSRGAAGAGPPATPGRGPAAPSEQGSLHPPPDRRPRAIRTCSSRSYSSDFSEIEREDEQKSHFKSTGGTRALYLPFPLDTPNCSTTGSTAKSLPSTSLLFLRPKRSKLSKQKFKK